MDRWYVPQGTRKEKTVFAFLCLIVVLFVALDLSTKYWIVSRFHRGELLHVIPGFFDITYVLNPGAAFGIFAGKGIALLVLSALAFVLLITFIRKITEGWLERYIAVALILSGIIGNSTDRIIRGSVVDFLRFYVRNWEWPSFNVADSCICVAVFMLLLSVFFRPEKNKNEKLKDCNDPQATE